MNSVWGFNGCKSWFVVEIIWVYDLKSDVLYGREIFLIWVNEWVNFMYKYLICGIYNKILKFWLFD